MTGMLVLAACSPKFDWREVRGGSDARFSVLLPAKPASLSREVNLGAVTVAMTMTAAEVDGVTFAVGSARLPDAATAAAVLPAMKTALVRNINGTVQRETSSAPGQPPSIEIEALGAAGPQGAAPRLLIARFIAKDAQLYQIVVAGPAGKVSRDAVDTFLSSFQPH